MLKNNLQGKLGVLMFLISLVVYILTLEPTTSFWDCSEFIACAYNLEIGHAPGAPLFMLLGRFFSLFAGGNVTKVAYMINMVSAVSSALTIMFLFWIICWFAKKLIEKSKYEYTKQTKQLIVFLSAAIGALSYAFTDSFWFSAVEGEVYATSSLFSAIVFWAILKWEEAEKGWKSTRWIVLIFYLLGLSVGVHLLNVLTIPAMALVFYYKTYKPSTKGVLTSLGISFLLVVGIIFIIIPGIATSAAYADLFFVNSLSLPVYSGALFFVIGTAVILYFAYKKTLNHRKKWIKTAVLCFSFWLIGYSTFTVLVIRSNSNPFVDMNNVENIFGLVDYLNREQYPKRPLFYGNSYNSPVVDIQKRYNYKLYNGKYHKDELNAKYIYDKNTLSLFPRMASDEPHHAEAYQNWVKISGKKVKVEQGDGSSQTIVVPTFFDNLKFFFSYQLGHMYFRYFMWNFSGRQNDIQGRGGKKNGNFITGIPFIDKAMIGEENLGSKTENQLKSRNKYYALPLLLGLLGLAFQYKKDKVNFMVNLMLFVLTGIAIVVYLNEIPITPRERDYAFVGSFFAFAIWIGLAFTAIIENIKQIRNSKTVMLISAIILFIIAPINLISDNWDDHNRSNRYTARDYAKNLLSSCEENAILFTSADNDTYPIWYLQEVEGYRKDVRQILQPFISIDWYGQQLNQEYGNRKSLNISLKDTNLLMKNNRYFPIINKIDSAIELNEAINFITSKDPRTKVQANNGETLSYLPGKKIMVKVNKENLQNSCSYFKNSFEQIPESIEFEPINRFLYREEFLILDIIAKNDWKRPIYFNNPIQVEKLGLQDYLYREGLLYRLLPFKKGLPMQLAKSKNLKEYQTITGKFKWGNVNHPDVFLDYQNILAISQFGYRQMFAEIAKELISLGEKEKALDLLNLAMETFPLERVPHSYFIQEIVEAYYLADENEKAESIVSYLKNQFELKTKVVITEMDNESRIDLYVLQSLIEITENKSSKLSGELARLFEKYYGLVK